MKNNEMTKYKSYENSIMPLVDIYEDAEKYTIEAEVPGLSKENLDITIKDRELILSGKILAEEDANTNSKFKEFNLRNYYRSFNINTDIKNDQIDAKLEDGVLTVSLPKSEKVKPRKIEVTKIN